MKVSANGIDLLKILEGERLTAYPDPGSADGHPYTVGVGHTGPEVVPGLKITKEQSSAYLKADLAKFEDAVSELVTVPLNQNQFEALTFFVFNIGVSAFKNSTLLRKLNRGNYGAVPAELARWDKNAGAVMPGLTKRRKREADLWLTP